jgi:2-dehydropantoate 2-reductase
MVRTIAVVGLGNIGAAIAGCLQAAGRHDVVACARRPILDCDTGTEEVSLRTLTDPSRAGPADWVLLCCEAQDTPSTAPWLAKLCTPDTHVAVLQNGIDHVARVTPYAGGATAVPTIVYYNGEYNGERLAPNHVRLRKVGRYDLMAPDGSAGRGFVRLLDGTTLNVQLSDDFATYAWRKLLLNVVVNPVTALTLQRQSVLRRPDVHALCLEVLAEAIAVGKADGTRLKEEDAARIRGLRDAKQC